MQGSLGPLSDSSQARRRYSLIVSSTRSRKTLRNWSSILERFTVNAVSPAASPPWHRDSGLPALQRRSHQIGELGLFAEQRFERGVV